MIIMTPDRSTEINLSYTGPLVHSFVKNLLYRKLELAELIIIEERLRIFMSG